MSNDDDKKSTYRLINALCHAKVIFADWAISRIVCHSIIEALLISVIYPVASCLNNFFILP